MGNADLSALLGQARPMTADAVITPERFWRAMWLVRVLSQGLDEVHSELDDYDTAHPELWGTCSEHPHGECGQRDLPQFYLSAVIYQADVREARRLLAELAEVT
jgi:hypothetical protein